ncbi:hypothetical protein MMA231_02447 [Asticcacaulis sp. MM231]|uniref:dienelactone hydrolase family protein n=1 Tax=Asticcacaulis sp. MM231 TaxID=3157666 RepID=UPI0032D572F9
MAAAIPGFKSFPHSFDGRGHRVYTKGEGAAIIFIHELPHISAAVVKVADAFVSAGFRVYLPSLLGEPFGKSLWYESAKTLADLCVSSEFKALFGHGEAHLTDWLRNLVRTVAPGSADKVGIIGLCFGGGFALGAATEPVVRAAVACEPSLPLLNKHDSGVDGIEDLPDRLRGGDLAIRLFRFQDDPVSPCERVGNVTAALAVPGVIGAFESRCLDKHSANPSYTKYPSPHSVITNHLVDEVGQPTQQVLDHIIAFFDWRLRDGDMPDLEIGKAADCSRFGCAKGHWKKPGLK